ncbi:hypothetical protein DICPUDRAFT_159422 [Dictyostelium purpureum]|uniref:Small-subunit processome Utp12 domain-containing protein n=1 Tax=Dictyostelium purpureum TaxID=5786 RepID=F1A432_DICPU|nr:uncharacterized protein DICPUDRAFT_159422 [Dictyostelium purpureum]EGC29042.1 hypothetical protein DICPUDRAFT_159422 [Dictyostelium purpureum]|eukprot:XP_003294426.1 hypothetical protein DICPUDRAFT_159422 [Dictyostelium purpureum]
MKFGYKFSNLLGTVYSKGNILFTPDGNSVISPVGNRLTVFDLVNHTSVTLPIQSRFNIRKIALSPNGQILISADESGHTLIINLQRQVVLGEYKFFKTPKVFSFSPNGAIIAVSVLERVFLFKTPVVQKQPNPLVRLSVFQHRSPVVAMNWSNDSLKLIVGCKNGAILIREGKSDKPSFFQVKGSGIINCFFGNAEATIVNAVTPTGLVTWNYKSKEDLEQEEQERKEQEQPEEEEQQEEQIKVTTENKKLSNGRWVLGSFKKFENYGVKCKVKTAVFHVKSKLLLVGFSTGQFILYEMPEFTELYKLNVSSHSINTAAINNTGEWLAFGCSDMGQLLVWEWRSETYILKQQGHSYNMNCVAYSPDGQTIATGGEDGKVKIWNTTSGYCFITFSDHEGPVTSVKYSPIASQNVVFSAGVDGTIRAFDLIRYRNFRTFVSPNKTQFSTLAIDPSGEIIAASSIDTFEIYVWSVRTGRLTDILSGHESPVCDLSFDPINPYLASASWDKSVKVWNIFEDREVRENIQHTSDVLACSYSSDGKKFVASCLDGTIQIYETSTWSQIGLIDGKTDIMGGRGYKDERLAKTSTMGKAFTKIAFTPNGECLIAGGDSKYICIYHVDQQVLVKKYSTSQNLSLDGISLDIDWRKVGEFGHIDTFDKDFDSDDDLSEKNKEFLPGTSKGDLSERTTKKKQRTTSISISPTGRAWACSTTEGLLIYSLDDFLFFDPTDLSIDINPENILLELKKKNYLKSLVMSIKLNEKEIIEQVFESIPFEEVQLVCQEFPIYYLKNFIQFLSAYFEKNQHLEYQMKWVKLISIYHGKYIKSNSLSMISSLRNLQKTITQTYNDLSKVCDDNIFSLEYFKTILIKELKSQETKAKQQEQKNLKQEKVSNDYSDDEEIKEKKNQPVKKTKKN